MDENEKTAERLLEERRRLGLTQDEFAEKAGVSKRTHNYYESGARQPDSDYLSAIARIGADVQYVLTGVRSSNMVFVAQELRGIYRAKKEEPPQRKEVDQQVLAGVLAGVDGYLAEQKLKMPPDKKAELVMLLCDFFNADTAKNMPAVKEAVAKIIQLRSGRR